MRTTANNIAVIAAVQKVNAEHGYKLEFNRFDICGKWVNFTLKTDSKIPGARTSASGRNLAKASWHAHGYVMDEIFKIEPEAVIVSNGEKYRAGFEWQDKNIGSRMCPCYFSETSIL